ncbi:MAG: hypothetical protein L3J07_00510 [Candidatus Magasanikbacteria bacterium]|nr:hypothetical protein [Candidatus Magasanikbacteria bacterium]
MKNLSILFVFLTITFFLTSTASADEAWKYCFSAEKVSCQSSNSSVKKTCLQKEVKLTSQCNSKALKRAHRKLEKKVFNELRRLKESGADLSERVSALEKFIKELREEEDLPNREEIIAIINEGIMLSMEELEANLRNQFDLLTMMIDGLERRITENEEDIKKLEKAFDKRSIQVAFGGLVLASLDGIYFGASARIDFPLGFDGDWLASIGGFAGSEKKGGFTYGIYMSLLTLVQEDGNWQMRIGPKLLAGFNAGTGAVGFESFTAGGGVEARLSYGNWAHISVSPFIGAGGVRTVSGGDIAFTGGALLRMEITPF